MLWCCGKEGCHLVACLLVIFLGMTNMTHVTLSLSLLTRKISTKHISSASRTRKRRWFLQEYNPQLQYLPTALHGFIEVRHSSMLAARAERQGERWLGSSSVRKDWFFQLWQSQHVVEWIQHNILPRYQLDNTVWTDMDAIFRGASTDEWWNKETMLGLLVWGDGKGQGDVHQQEFLFGTFKPELSNLK